MPARSPALTPAPTSRLVCATLKTGGALVKEIEALGFRRALSLQMNMTSMPEIRRGIEQAAKHFGRLDILVNNAGLGKSDPVEDVKEEDFDHTVAVNLKGTFFASQAAGRIMIAQKYGRIINLSSQAGFVALPGEAVYCMTKAGIAHPHALPGDRMGQIQHHHQQM